MGYGRSALKARARASEQPLVPGLPLWSAVRVPPWPGASRAAQDKCLEVAPGALPGALQLVAAHSPTGHPVHRTPGAQGRSPVASAALGLSLPQLRHRHRALTCQAKAKTMSRF